MNKMAKAFGIVFVSLLTPLQLFAGFDWSVVTKFYDDKNMYSSKNGYNDWLKCFNPKFHYHPITLNSKGELIPECLPDTLYSWGHKHRFNVFQTDASEKRPWNALFESKVFAHINPLATFGYGEILIRIKLKPDTNFFYYGDDKLDFDQYCTILLKSEKDKKALYRTDNTVIVRAWSHGSTSGVDYILCSPKPMHSWSYNMPKTSDEISASLLWNINMSAENGWVPYVKINGAGALFGSDVDSKFCDWSSKYLYNNLTEIRSRVESRRRNVIYNPSIKKGPKEQSVHFKTNRPIYWNH